MTHFGSSICRRLTWAAGLTAAGLLMATGQAFAAAADDGQILRENAANAIPESYVVVLEDEDASRNEARAEIASLADEHDADVEHRYTNTVRGFSATMTREQALELSTDPAVAYVEQNRTISALEHPVAHAVLGPGPHRPARPAAQQLLHLREHRRGGEAYIIDTGIRTTHSAFGGRASWGFNTVDANDSDCNGHGTHVAGTVGGAPTAWPRASSWSL